MGFVAILERNLRNKGKILRGFSLWETSRWQKKIPFLTFVPPLFNCVKIPKIYKKLKITKFWNFWKFWKLQNFQNFHKFEKFKLFEEPWPVIVIIPNEKVLHFDVFSTPVQLCKNCKTLNSTSIFSAFLHWTYVRSCVFSWRIFLLNFKFSYRLV